MGTVTIPKKEYKKLVEQRMRHRYVRSISLGDIFSPPLSRSIGEIISAFKDAGKYSVKFLKELEKGLRRSSYFHRR